MIHNTLRAKVSSWKQLALSHLTSNLSKVWCLAMFVFDKMMRSWKSGLSVKACARFVLHVSKVRKGKHMGGSINGDNLKWMIPPFLETPKWTHGKRVAVAQNPTHRGAPKVDPGGSLWRGRLQWTGARVCLKELVEAKLKQWFFLDVFFCFNGYVCMYVCMYIYICMYVYIYIYICVFSYVVCI